MCFKYTLGSLFDGLGGWQIAAMRAGIQPIWSSEIEKFTCALTKVRFPDTEQLGDITKIDGGTIPPVDIVTMGSPCQDLSIAGRREGLAGKRSGLFLRATEFIRQMRERYHEWYPKIVIWENVLGAFSTNRGADFQAVLESFTETHIPMPRGGRWANAGMVRSNKCNIVWRTLDAQYWGVPQRCRRIFLVVDYTRGCTEEILFKPESLSWDIEQSKEQRERIADRTCKGFGGSVAYCIRNSIINRKQENGGNGLGISKEISYTLDTTGAYAVAVIADKDDNQRVFDMSYRANVIREQKGDECFEKAVPFDMTHANDVIRENRGSIHTLQARMGTGGNQIPLIYARPSYADLKQDETAVTLRASGGSNGGGSENLVADKLLRKLTPLECERLQGLPDNWTLIDDKSCSDSARYKAIGNGMAQPCADFVMKRVCEFLQNS